MTLFAAGSGLSAGRWSLNPAPSRSSTGIRQGPVPGPSRPGSL